MDQFTNLSLIIHTEKVTLVGLKKTVTKNMINRLSQKISYDSKINNMVIDGFNPNDVSSHFYIIIQSIVTLGIR